MRITGGIHRGRRLKVPAGDRVRPTSDKVKQALFNILGERIAHARFLDLFAGTGAVGIEALSRGAARVLFIDDSRASLQAVRQNVEQAGYDDRSQVIASRAESFIRKSEEQFDIVFLDPPYTTDIAPFLELLDGSTLLAPGAVVVAEHHKKQQLPERAGGLERLREAVYGDTVLTFYQDRGQGAEATRQEGEP